MAQVLHITPHLGGGVGKAVAALLGGDDPGGFRHRVFCLEAPEKDAAVHALLGAGWPVDIAPPWGRLRDAIAAADIVLLHFWAHPLTAALVTRTDWPEARLLAWSHMSGLGGIRFPTGLASLFDRFVLSAEASRMAFEPRKQDDHRIHVVSSGIVDGLPPPPRRNHARGSLAAGYVGTLTPGKLHPMFVEMLAAVDLPGFSVTLVGDAPHRVQLLDRATRKGRPGLLNLVGYQADVTAWLERFDVLVYLLNPDHYGTAENALLEAMAMGVVPVVMDNPAERAIVDHAKTGMIVRDSDDLAATLKLLADRPDMRRDLSTAAAASVRNRFRADTLRQSMSAIWRALLAEPKRPRPDAAAVLGQTAADWFRAFRKDGHIFHDDGRVVLSGSPDPTLFDHAKGSVFQFQRAFPDDARLARWSDCLTARKALLAT